jgi:hypothetical protein
LRVPDITTVLSLPPPDPYESQEPRGLELNEPAAIFLTAPPSPEAHRLSSAVLDWRPGALVVVAEC